MDRVDESAYVAMRRPQDPEAIAPQTMQWLASLPAHVRPRDLPVLFTRIANQLARVWSDSTKCLPYLDSLLMDGRAYRKGFPLDVAMEIAGLKDHYETVVHQYPQTTWDEILVRRHS